MCSDTARLLRPCALIVPFSYTTEAPSCSKTPRNGTNTRPARSCGGGLRLSGAPLSVTDTLLCAIAALLQRMIEPAAAAARIAFVEEFTGAPPLEDFSQPLTRFTCNLTEKHEDLRSRLAIPDLSAGFERPLRIE